MKVRVYRNLDRPMSILGIKGKFIGVAGGLIILDLIVGLVVGKLTHAFVAMGLIVILLIVEYIAITEVQIRYGQKFLDRILWSMGMPKFVIVNSKVWKR